MYVNATDGLRLRQGSMDKTGIWQITKKNKAADSAAGTNLGTYVKLQG